MSLQNEIAKIYVRLVFRENEEDFDSIKTQKKLSLAEPPKNIAQRCELLATSAAKSFWIDRENSKRGVLIYLHGGAFYFGPVREHWDFIARLARQTQMAAIVVGFRMSPQNPFPAALDDIIETVTNTQLPENMVFIGDSSGGGMCISAFFRLKELNAPLPEKLILLSPWLDATLQNPAIELNKHEDVMMTVGRLSKAAVEYANGADLKNPLISPMFGEIEGLPPTLIQTGTADLLLWDCRKFYLKCLDAGLNVKYEEYRNAFHDFMMIPFLPESRRALRTQLEFLSS